MEYVNFLLLDFPNESPANSCCLGLHQAVSMTKKNDKNMLKFERIFISRKIRNCLKRSFLFYVSFKGSKSLSKD